MCDLLEIKAKIVYLTYKIKQSEKLCYDDIH